MTNPTDTHPLETAVAPPSRARSSRLRITLEGGVLPILLVLLILLVALHPTSGPFFLSGPNITNLLKGQSVTGVIAIAMVIPLVSGYFDLSVAAVASVASVIFATVVGPQGYPIWAGIIAALLLSGVVGCVTGYLVAYARFDAFVITLGIYTLLLGVVQWFTNGSPVSEGISDSVGDWGSQKFLGLPYPFLALMAVATIVWYVVVRWAHIEGDGVGMVRQITAQDGATIHETLQVLDAEKHLLSYSVVPPRGAPSTVSIRLVGEPAGPTTVIWQSLREGDVSEDVRERVSATLRARIAALAAVLADR